MFRRKAFLHWYTGEGMDELKEGRSMKDEGRSKKQLKDEGKINKQQSN